MGAGRQSRFERHAPQANSCRSSLARSTTFRAVATIEGWYRQLKSRLSSRKGDPSAGRGEAYMHTAKSLRRYLATAVRAALLLVTLATVVSAQEAPPPTPEDQKDRLAPFVPTPQNVVEAMLRLASVDKYDRVYDLGSGDGRIVITAAQKFHAEAVGVELDDDLYKESSARISELGLQHRAKILHANMYHVSLRMATVVTLYLLTSVNERLKPVLERDLRPGARVVTHDFQIPGWTPEKSEMVFDDKGVSHTIYLYVRPE
jgi:hypothetical protein